MSQFYQVSLIGAYAGQSVVNVLWYRAAINFPPAELLFDLQAAIAAEVKENLWDSLGGGSDANFNLRDLMPTSYLLDKIVVSAWDDVLDPVSSDPSILTVNQAGLNTSSFMGTTPYILMRANLEPVVGPGIGLPRSGHLKIGPVDEDIVDNTGRLTVQGLARFAYLGDRLAANITTEAPPAVFFPIRVRVTRVAGLVTVITYKDVSDFDPDALVRSYKGRRQEA